MNSTDLFVSAECEYDVFRADTVTKHLNPFKFRGHCSGGVGAWEIGQTLGAVAGSVLPGGDGLSPDRNVLMAMVRWVEEGVAPDIILGTKFVNDDPDEGVQFSRRHCRLPMRNTFVGGNSTLPESWSCQ